MAEREVSFCHFDQIDDGVIRTPLQRALIIVDDTVCTENLSELMTRRYRLSWWNDRATLFRPGRPGLATKSKLRLETETLRFDTS
jgi:hypothetical protein